MAHLNGSSDEPERQHVYEEMNKSSLFPVSTRKTMSVHFSIDL
jgi:hypothetical protein